MVYYMLKLSSKLQWLILLYFYNKKTKQKSENIPLKLKKKNPFWAGLHFSFYAAPFYTTLAVKRDFQLVFSGIYAHFKAFCIARGV